MSWKLALLLLIVWWGTGDWIWTKLRSDPWQTGNRSLLENQLLAIDALEALPPPANSLEAAWRSHLASVATVDQILAPLLIEGNVATGVWIEYALVCHEFAQFDESGKWEAREAAAVEKITEVPSNWSYYSAAEDLLHKRTPSEVSLSALKQACSDYPGDWWVNRTADFLGHRLIANDDRLAIRRQKALHALSIASTVEIVVMFAGLASALILGMKRHLLTLPLRASATRLHRLWNPFAIVALFVVTNATVLPANIWIGSHISRFAAALFGLHSGQLSPNAYLVSSVISSATTACLVLSIPLFLWMAFGPRKKSIWPVFGTSRNDFLSSKCWFVGMSACWVSLLLNYFADMIWRWIGLGGNALDVSSTWTFVTMGPAGWPAALAFGVLLAPFVEEVVFRGFLFSACRARYGPLAAGLLSSALFAAAHFYSPFGTVCVFIFGAVFAFIYQVTGRLSWSMAAHACVNLVLVPIQLLEVTPA